jgi:hypothetical protein
MAARSRLSRGPSRSPQPRLRCRSAGRSPRSPGFIPSTSRTSRKDANRRGRFFIAFDGTIERSVEGWARYETERRAWRDERIIAKAFDPGFRPILAAMRSCRILGVTPKLLRTTPNAPLAWLARCTVRGDRALHVVLDADGAREDVSAWWWLCCHASPVVTCDAGVLDAATLFTIGDGVHFATTRFLPRSVLAHAKAEASRDGTVALAPGASEHGWGMLVVAEPPVIGELAVQAVRSFPAEEKQVRVHETLDTGILSAIESSTYWTGDIDSEHFERRIIATLKRGAKHPEIPRDAIRALAAAEGIAIAEGRGPATPSDGMAHLVAGFAREHAGKADPLSDATIELALRTVQCVRDAASWERREYVSEEGRSAFRAELDGPSEASAHGADYAARARPRAERSARARAAPGSADPDQLARDLAAHDAGRRPDTRERLARRDGRGGVGADERPHAARHAIRLGRARRARDDHGRTI